MPTSASPLDGLPNPTQFPTGAAGDPLDRLRDPRAESGYHGVERHGLRFRARTPFSKRPMACRSTAREAAADLLAWWRAHFGPDWPRYHAARHCPAWRLERAECGRWRLVVFVKGTEIRLNAAFESRAAGRAYLRQWTGQLFRSGWRAVRRAG